MPSKREKKTDKELRRAHARLCNSIVQSRKALEKARQIRLDIIKQQVGNRLFDDGSPEPVPVNLIGTFVDTMSRTMVSRNPQILLTTDNLRATYVVSTMKQWINDLIEASNHYEILHRITVDSFNSIGIAYTALSSPVDVAGANNNLEVGEPFLRRVSFDDFAYDVAATSFDEASYICHRFRPTLDSARLMYDKSIEPMDPQENNEDGTTRATALGRGDGFGMEEYEPRAELWSVYCPAHKVTKILDSDLSGDPDMNEKPLAEIPWVGHDSGPYDFLGYSPIPDSALFVPPLLNLYDLHIHTNNLYRKLISQSRNQKRITLFAGLTDTEMDEIRNMPDGGAGRVSTLQGIMTQDMNGPNAALAQMAVHFRDMFSRQAGNLDVMAGLRANEKTASQSQMLNQNSALTVSAMQETATNFASRVYKKLCWYHWHNPAQVNRSLFIPSGMRKLAVQRVVTPPMRFSIPYDQLRLKVDPFSMPHLTPRAKAAALMQIITQVLMPIWPLAQQQGEIPKIRVLMEKLSEYMDLPELREIMQSVNPPEEATGGQTGDGPAKPPVTTREYQRFGAGEDSAAAEEADMMNNMAAAGESQQGQGQ